MGLLAALFLSKQERNARARRRALEAELDARLQRRKASRAILNERARLGAATKVHEQVARDPLLLEQVIF
ncbi:hypothetical protein [Sphingomonas sp. CARO-RG-8B-R24-01]|uniref:hypothetical protein n=1 Tax=Sphingomonas sp. CARO-RG-8B-R24-01 TaxID=2914831 RepID=UPI001F58E1BE|nr:hypothetical protein [Sphingomonas sp. CARO-RG-8B-R24-01]